MIRMPNCPRCKKIWTEFLETGEIGSTKYKGAIPHVDGIERVKIDHVAYYKCKSCGIVFYVDIPKGA